MNARQVLAQLVANTTCPICGGDTMGGTVTNVGLLSGGRDRLAKLAPCTCEPPKQEGAK